MSFAFDPSIRARVLALPGRLGRRGRSPDGGSSRDAGGRLEFHEHRPYTDRDDPRDLDWNLYLRLDTLAVKTYTRSEVPDVQILLDRSGSMGPEGGGKDRIARELTLALGYLALAQGSDLDVGFLGEGGPVSVGRYRSPRNLEALVRVLTHLGPPDGPTRLEALVHLPPSGPRGRAVYLITDALADPIPVASLVALRRGISRGTLLLVCGSAERDLDLSQPFLAEDPETGRTLATPGGPALTQAYREEWSRHAEGVADLARQHGLLLRAVEDSRPFEEIVVDLLGAGR